MSEFDISNIKKVFLAEDDADDFYFFNSALLSLSKSVDVVRTADGVMLLSLLESSLKPDIIFIDLNMPFKDGLGCLKAIKSNRKYSFVPVIMFSSSSSATDIDACYDNGADFYFVKSASFSSLVEQFKKLFASNYFINNIRPSRENFVFNGNAVAL